MTVVMYSVTMSNLLEATVQHFNFYTTETSAMANPIAILSEVFLILRIKKLDL